MDPRHREFLEKCHHNLAESVTDADQLVEVLSRGGTLSPAERHELARGGGGGAEKVELLVKILLRKDRDHFADFCSALEESTYSVLSTMPSDSESSGSLSSVSSPPLAHVDAQRVHDKMETVLFQLRHVTRERDELRKRLALSSPGSTFDDCRPNSKAGHDYERLKLQCMKAMADLQSLQNQHNGTLKRCEEAVKKADYYTLHSRLAGEHSQLKDELEAVRLDNVQLLREHDHAKQNCEELRRLRDDHQREVADMRLLHQQVIREGSSDALNKLYDSAVDKLESVRNDYEGLRKLYNDKTANHNADLSRLDHAEEENRRLQKQLDVLMKQRDAAIHYQQQYSSSIRLDQQELSKVAAQNVELQHEMERLQSEVTRFKTQQLKANKECENFKDERDSVISEYRLIMSERDQVIKEVERLQTGLEVAEAKLKNTSSEQRVANEELEALRQELSSSLMDRDRALCEKNELLEKYCHEVKDKAEAQKELSQACRDMETVREERDVARKERTEAIIQRDQLLQEYYQARQLQKQDSATLDMERASKEIEMLRKQYEAVSQELSEALQEAEVAKCRRDWAFQERDKIVGERESVTLCDNLRRERDRAVSDLADALRNLDDTRKQKNDAVRELKELEKMEDQLEKEARYRQLMAHSSHDSAIDMDSVEWETEVVEFEKRRQDMDLKALGFDIAEGVNDPYLPGDCGVFVSKVDKGSLAEGRLVNDWLLKINNVDLTSKDRKQAIKAVLSGEGVLNMVVRRRKSLGGRVATPVQINLSGHKQINGIPLDNKSLPECDALLRACRESLCISLAKLHRRPFTFTPVLPDGGAPSGKAGGGTWPKVIAGASVPECAQLSIYKRSKQRKSIFDMNTFRRPEAPPKLDYMSLSQLPKHSPQSSVAESFQGPPTPPARSDSFRFKHSQQNSSASDSTIPGSPSRGSSPVTESEAGKQAYYSAEASQLESMTLGDDDGSQHREPDKRRCRPKSAPALRRNVTPLHIPPPMQFSNDEHSPEPMDLLRFSPMRNNRYPCPAKTSVLRNTVYPTWSQEMQTGNCPPGPTTQHHGRHSVDLNHKLAGDMSESSPPSHGTHSLPSSSRLPYLEEPRNVTVQRGAEPLGISIVSGETGGVFVSKVTAGSIAHQAHLEYGDQLLEQFNGINLRNANEQQARLVIGQQCDTVTILAQYNPHMFQLGNHSRSSTPDNRSVGDTLSEQDEGTVTPPSKQTTPVTSPHSSFAEPRLVRLKRIQAELGVQICGGNLCGILVESLDEDSPAKTPDGLLPGDLLLEYNGVSMKNKTKEEAYLELLKPAETVTFKVQNCVDELAAISQIPGDGFFIRSLYERVADVEQELSFKKDDILYVEDTLPNGNFGYWTAWHLDEKAQKMEKGQIPSKYIDQELYRRHGVADMKDDGSGGSKTLSAAARRSFFRRRLKHKRNGSKDGKDLMASEAMMSDYLPITEDGVSLMYQRVQKVECLAPRPVLILGPLAEASKDMLVNEAPAKFSRCLPIMKASQQAIERGVKDCVFIDYKRRSGHFDVTTVASIKEMTEKDCHCLLDIAPHAIERLHSVHVYPIVIFIRYKNAKQIEQRDPLYIRDKLSQKLSKEQFEAAQKTEQEYSPFFTG
uniref:Discs large MAGUK scaffold protein 5 n=1 Tax=Hippocampus comes TaxID=109280 RepID=A0A3Q2X996_HIPCM